MTSQSEHGRADIAFHELHAPLYDGEVADEYQLYDSLVLLPFLREFQRLGLRLTVLDLGCGTGAVTVHLARLEARVHAVDHSPDMLAIAEDKVRRASPHVNATSPDVNATSPHVNATFQVADAADLPFDSSQFDLVTCQRVLHHIPDIQPVFAEIKRVLKPDGSFYLSDGVGDWTPDFKRLLSEAGVSHELQFFTHVGMQRYLSTRQRTRLVRLLSAPWKHRRGDLLFAYARNSPEQAQARTSDQAA